MQFSQLSGNQTQVKSELQKKYDDLQSKVITFLRFPLIVCVIFIHNEVSNFSVSGQTFGAKGTSLPLFTWCSHFVVILCRVAVPLFFFMSGFLFFLGVDTFTAPIYVQKLKSRFRSLLIPYLFWNFVLLLVLFVMSRVPSLSGFMNKKPELNIRYLVSAFWSADGTLPVSYQFWFIRDLMVTVILTPLVYVFIRFLKWPGLVALAILWYYGYGFPVPGLSMIAIFFFTFGSWFSLNKKNVVETAQKMSFLFWLYPLMVIVDLLTESYAWNPLVHNTGIIAGIFFWFGVVSNLLRTGRVKVHPFLAQSSFFIFAIHEPLLTIIRRILFLIFHPQSDPSLTFFYFFVVIIVVVLALLVYSLSRWMFPKFTTVITGGR